MYCIKTAEIVAKQSTLNHSQEVWFLTQNAEQLILGNSIVGGVKLKRTG